MTSTPASRLLVASLQRRRRSILRFSSVFSPPRAHGPSLAPMASGLCPRSGESTLRVRIRHPHFLPRKPNRPRGGSESFGRAGPAKKNPANGHLTCTVRRNARGAEGESLGGVGLKNTDPCPAVAGQGIHWGGRGGRRQIQLNRIFTPRF